MNTTARKITTGTAYDVLMTASETELADVFAAYGHDDGRRIARAIMEHRAEGSLPLTTLGIVHMIANLEHPSRRHHGLHLKLAAAARNVLAAVFSRSR
jgi:16S rRNA C1402 N4-methylase RsmH